MRIVCQQKILMEYHALFVISENGSKFKIVVCCEFSVALNRVKIFSFAASPQSVYSLPLKVQTGRSLTLYAPIETKVVCFSRLLKMFKKPL